MNELFKNKHKEAEITDALKSRGVKTPKKGFLAEAFRKAKVTMALNKMRREVESGKRPSPLSMKNS